MHEGCCIDGCNGWSIDDCHMVFHEIFYLETTYVGVIPVYLCHSGVLLCVSVCCEGHWFHVKRDYVVCVGVDVLVFVLL